MSGFVLPERYDSDQSGEIGDVGQSARFTLILEHAGALRQMFWPFDKLALGESHIYGDFEVDGDFHAFMGVLRFLLNRKMDLRTKLRLLRMMLALPNERRPRRGRQGVKLSGEVHSRERDRQAIGYHYDTGLYGLSQTLQVKPDKGRSGVPMLREDWYA